MKGRRNLPSDSSFIVPVGSGTAQKVGHSDLPTSGRCGPGLGGVSPVPVLGTGMEIEQSVDDRAVSRWRRRL